MLQRELSLYDYNLYNSLVKKELNKSMSKASKQITSANIQKELTNDPSATSSPVQTPASTLPNNSINCSPEISGIPSSLASNLHSQLLNEKYLLGPINNELNWNLSSSVSGTNNKKYSPSTLAHNLSKKEMPKKLSVVRMFAAFKRRRKALKMANTDLAKRDLGRLYEFVDKELSKHKVSEFRLRSETDTKKQTISQPVQKTDFIKKWAEEDNFHQEQSLESDLLNIQTFESKLALNQDRGGAATPPSNNISKEIMRKRLEESPLNKGMIEVSDYVYNSDDDLLINLLEHSQYQS